MKKIMVILIFVVLASGLVLPYELHAQQNRQSTERANTYVLIFTGVNKDPEERQAKDKAVIKLRKFFLNDARVDAERLRVLVDSNSFARRGAELSTAENLKSAVAELEASIKPADTFIFYYVGQANIVAGKLRINLPGGDITHEQLAGWLKEIKASSVLIVLDCPGAGLAVKALTGPGRIIVCGSRSDQPYSTRFSEYFIPALVDDESDTDGDEKISLLEAFTLTSKRLDDLYRQQDLLKTETPLLEDDADGVPSQQPWKYEEYKKDGLAASKFYFLMDQSRAKTYVRKTEET
jgi:hypothetical protein